MKIERTSILNFEEAFYGMRLPMMSHDKADSILCGVKNCEECPFFAPDKECEDYVIGENDLKLAQKLIAAGPEHRKFLRQIMVSVTITAPLYWWKEFDTYKVGTVANSSSTMHKLANTPITLKCFEIDDYDEDLDVDRGDQSNVTEAGRADGFIAHWHMDTFADYIVTYLEDLRQMYIKTKDKRYWKELVRWLPEGWLQTRTVTMNYENLRSMYFQRKSHKLSEWHQFCAWIESLSYSHELILYKGNRE